MIELDVASLILPAFIAGLFTFLAPCTLPLVPGYLGFISGVSLDKIKDPEQLKKMRGKIFINGLLYVLGFSAVFILMGSLFGLGGQALIQYRIWLTRIGGIFVIVFGLYMMHVFDFSFLKFLSKEKHVNVFKWLKPGKASSSFLFGATFAFGWSPCVGPILGSILLLASSSATVGSGAFLLLVFSLGLGLPFLFIAAAIGSASKHLHKIQKHLKVISIIGGAFLLLLGVLMVTNKMGVWFGFFYETFSFLDYESKLINFL